MSFLVSEHWRRMIFHIDHRFCVYLRRSCPMSVSIILCKLLGKYLHQFNDYFLQYRSCPPHEGTEEAFRDSNANDMICFLYIIVLAIFHINKARKRALCESYCVVVSMTLVMIYGRKLSRLKVQMIYILRWAMLCLSDKLSLKRFQIRRSIVYR